MTGGLTGVGEAVGRSMWAELARMEAPCKPGQSRVYHVLPARDKFSTVLRDKVRRRLSPGLRLVYTWFTPAGPQQVLDGPERESEAVVTPGLRLVYTWFTPGLHLVLDGPEGVKAMAIDLHLAHIGFTPGSLLRDKG